MDSFRKVKGKELEERKGRAWAPDGDYLPPWSAMIDYDKAQDVMKFGADFIMKTPSTIFTKTEELHWCVYENSADNYLAYFKNAEQKETGLAKGTFSLKDVVSAEFDGSLKSIKIMQSSKRDGIPRRLEKVPPTRPSVSLLTSQSILVHIIPCMSRHR